ncbi:MAG: 4'-phosphopantetheinyl transferase superfamily protein [Balneolaceae bacterium]|nr:4'-phosphopantetheinyl transferase superfamily protein [Balneolaceae bacterium]
MENITAKYCSLLPSDLNIAIGEIGSTFSEELLSSIEQTEYQNLQHRRRRDEFLSTRGIIKELAGRSGWKGLRLKSTKMRFGKPYGVYNNQRFELSLAHTNEKVICVLSPGLPVGIDIEPEDRSVTERLRDRILHAEERALLQDQPLIRVWTLKESLVKLNGRGLRTNLNEIKIQRLNPRVFSAVLGDDKSARICSFRHQKHWIAVAYYQN